MIPIKTERILYYEGGLERRSSISCDENGTAIKPDMSLEASDEWDKIIEWFHDRNLEHLLDGSALRDHCLAVAEGNKDTADLT